MKPDNDAIKAFMRKCAERHASRKCQITYLMYKLLRDCALPLEERRHPCAIMRTWTGLQARHLIERPGRYGKDHWSATDAGLQKLADVEVQVLLWLKARDERRARKAAEEEKSLRLQEES